MRSNGDRVLRVQAQLTDRDRLLLDWLADHRVLTTFQICHALFGSLDFAQRRMLKLHRLGAGGPVPAAASWRRVLSVALRARSDRRRVRGRQPRPDTAAAGTDGGPQAAYRDEPDAGAPAGVNRFFTDLAGWARTHPPARLERWWPEQRCAEPGAFGTTLISPVRPDGHGVFAESGRRVAFFAEFDTGFEQHSVLLSKVSRYAAHVAKGGPAWPVLFWLPSTARERRLHQMLAGVDIAVPVATAARDSLDAGVCAADPVWLVVGGSDAPRRLVDLDDLGDPAPDVELSVVA